MVCFLVKDVELLSYLSMSTTKMLLDIGSVL